MPCARCEAPTVAVAVPESLADAAPADAILVCTRCLTVEPAESGEADPDLERISEALPPGEPGVAALVLVGLLESLATNRQDIEVVIEEMEAAGGDPLLVLEDLANDPDLDPAVALERRRHQLEQLVM